MYRIFAIIGCVLVLVAGTFLARLALEGQPSPSALSSTVPLPSEMTLISHAGSGLPFGAYSNSLEALERAVADNIGLIEVDFNWTSDGQLVLLHSWDRELSAWFDLPFWFRVKRELIEDDLTLSESDFLALDMRWDLTQMSLPDLIGWLSQHPDVRIVTDFKKDNLAALQYVAATYPASIDQIVPQIYSFEEYDQTRALGYTDIVFTGYKADPTMEEVLAFEASHALFAVTLPFKDLVEDDYRKLEQMQTPLWVHTINAPDIAASLRAAGVEGLYTDLLLPY